MLLALSTILVGATTGLFIIHMAEVFKRTETNLWHATPITLGSIYLFTYGYFLGFSRIIFFGVFLIHLILYMFNS